VPYKVWSAFISSMGSLYPLHFAFSFLLVASFAEAVHARPASTALAANSANSRANIATPEDKSPGKENTQKTSSNKVSTPLYVSTKNDKRQFDNISEAFEDNRLLREHQEVLIDYTKQLRAKYKKLQEYCLEAGGVRCQSTAFSDEVSLPIEKTVSLSVFKALESDYKNLEADKKKLEEKVQAHTLELNQRANNANELEEEHQNNLKSVQAQLELLKNEKSGLKESYEKQLEELKINLAQKEEQETQCLGQLEQSQNLVSQIPQMQKEMLALKNEVLLRKSAEELLQPVSLHKPKADKGNVKPSLRESTKDRVVKEAPIRTPGRTVPEVNATPSQGAVKDELVSDVQIGEVTGKKVSLRLGPGTNHSSVMDVRAGTRLIVESKEGDWYRVTAPTGGRAFIHSDYLRVSGQNSHKTQLHNPLLSKKDPTNIQPSLPMKPVRKVGQKDNLDTQVPESSLEEGMGVEIGENSSEAIAIERLMKAMSAQSKETP